MNPIPAPSIEYAQLAPILIVLGAAVAGVLVEAFAPRRARHPAQVALTLAALTAALVCVAGLAGTAQTVAVGSVVVDGPTLFLQGTLLVVALLGTLLVAERKVEAVKELALADAFAAQASTVPGSAAEQAATRSGASPTEVYPLLLFAVGGMMVLPASGDLLTMFVALEVLSLPLYVLCGLARRRRLLSQEAALKYFLLGAFSSAFFLYGTALLYGYAGTTDLSGIADAVAGSGGDDTLALLGVGLLAVGLLFKVGAVPFHTWTPDVYQGAPTPVTAFMAAATKVAAFGALLRVLYVAVPGLAGDWRPMLWGVAILTMLAGSVLAVTQTDVKRMLAYSSVAHAGFILVGVVSGVASGVAATLFYLLAYGLSTLAAFAVVGLVREPSGAEATALARWAGLGRRYPLVGVMFSLFLLSFAGIPLTSGFVAKFTVFAAAFEGGAAPLVVVGVVGSAIAAYFYVRVIVLLFFTEPADSAAVPTVVMPSVLTRAAVGVATVVTVVLGLAPQAALELAEKAAVFAG